MKLGLRIKIVGIVGFALAVMLFLWSYKDLKTLKTQYLQTVQAHAEVMAQFLIFLAQGELAEGYTKQYVLDVEQHSAKLPEICQKVLTANPNKRAIYVAVIPFAGIYVSSALLIAFFMIRFGEFRSVISFPSGALAAGVAFAIFELWFLVALPKGPLETYLGY